MTKEQFLNFNEEYVYCECCGRTVSINDTTYGKIKANGSTSRCNLCDWIHRHNGIPDIDRFTSCQIETALEMILFQTSSFVNDIAEKIRMPLDDTINLIRSLRIGNKAYDVKCSCSCCGNEITKPISVYIKNKHMYCSNECYWKHKSKVVPKGTDNPTYKRVVTACTNCGESLSVIPSSYEKKNKFGDNHNFCSQKCYWEYRSKYYIGEKSACYGLEFSPERLEKTRKMMVLNSRSGERFNSKIQITTNELLEKNNISYKREHIVDYYAIDNFLTDSGLFIEVMGDYWHASPLRYNSTKYGINYVQRRTLQHDKQKHTYIKNKFGKEILYLWEKDINSNPDLCEMLILRYINNDGVLDNYHSYNYSIDSGTLKINDDIIKPYQDMTSDEYKHLFVDRAG